MKKILLVVLAVLCFVGCDKSSSTQSSESPSLQNPQATQKKAFGMSPPLTVLLEILAPENLIGLNYKPYPEDTDFMPPNVSTLPVLGHSGDRSVLFETIASYKPDIVFFTENTPQETLEMYEKVGIHAVQVPGYNFEDLSLAIQAYKDAFNDKLVSQRADLLLEFVKGQNAKLKSLQESVKNRPSVYFAQGFDGLQSQCADEDKKDLAWQIGGFNALPCSILDNPMERVTINFEILASIDPEVIFVREIPFFKTLTTNPPKEWSNLKAIKNNRIYYAPSTPSNWLMRPPSVMQTLGFEWAFAKIQPELLSDKEVQESAQYFFKTFLRDLSNEDYERIQGLRE